MDVTGRRYADLRRAGRRTAGAWPASVGRLCLGVFGCRARPGRARGTPTRSASPCSRPTSCATSARTCVNGRVYLPQEDLDRFGVRAAHRRARRAGRPGRHAGRADPVRGRAGPALVRRRACGCSRCSTGAAPPAAAAMAGIYRAAARPHRGRARRSCTTGGCRCPAGRRRRRGPGPGRGWARVTGRQGRRRRRRPGRHHRGAALADAGRAVDPARGPAPARRADLLVPPRRAHRRQRAARVPALLHRLPGPAGPARRRPTRSRCRPGSTSRCCTAGRRGRPGCAGPACRRRCTWPGRCCATASLRPARAGSASPGPRSRCAGSTRPTRPPTRQTSASWLAAHGQGARAIAGLWDLSAWRRSTLPAARGVAGAGRDGLPGRAAHRPGGRRHRLVAGTAAAGCTATRRGGAGRGRRDCAALGARSAALDRTERQLAVGASTPSRSRSDQVVLAVPPPAAEAAAARRRLARCRPAGPSGWAASPIVNVHVVYDRPVLDEPFFAAVGHARCSGSSTAPRQSGLATGQYLAVSLSAADDDDRPAGRRRWSPSSLPALAALLPAARRRARCWTSSSPGSGTRRSGRRRAAAALRPRRAPALPGLVARRRVDRHRLAGDHGGRRAQRRRRGGRPARPGRARREVAV